MGPVDDVYEHTQPSIRDMADMTLAFVAECLN